MKNETIKSFWEWFSKKQNDFGEKFENIDLLEELDERVGKLGDFSWEVGPGKIKENALTISPNGNYNLLKDTKEIVIKAIPCLNWEFYHAKPVKEWDLVFDFETEDEETVEINANEWCYVLEKFEDGTFRITVKTINIAQLTDEDQLIAVEILLDGVLGEEERLMKISEIEIVEEFDDKYKNKESNIKVLAAHLKQLSL